MWRVEGGGGNPAHRARAVRCALALALAGDGDGDGDGDRCKTRDMGAPAPSACTGCSARPANGARGERWAEGEAEPKLRPEGGGGAGRASAAPAAPGFDAAPPAGSTACAHARGEYSRAKG